MSVDSLFRQSAWADAWSLAELRKETPLAHDRGLIKNVNDTVATYMPRGVDLFTSEHNATITRLTSSVGERQAPTSDVKPRHPV